MEGLRTGLRHRLERALRQVEEQHRLLRDVDAELSRAVAAGDAQDATAWLARKRDALRAHFAWEEEVVFPAVHGLLPGTGRELEALEREHGHLLAQLERSLDGGRGPDAREVGTLRRRLVEHERHEERLVGLALAIGRPEAG